MTKKIAVAVLAAFTFAGAAFSQHSPEELEKARLLAKGREEGLMKARDVLKAKIDRMRTKLESQERLLDNVNQRLDNTRQNIVEIEKRIQDQIEKKF